MKVGTFTAHSDSFPQSSPKKLNYVKQVVSEKVHRENEKKITWRSSTVGDVLRERNVIVASISISVPLSVQRKRR